jgi:hypothetical protein
MSKQAVSTITEAVVKVAAGTYCPQYAPGPAGESIAGAYLSDNDLTDRDKTFILREGVEIRGGYTASGEDIDESARKARFNGDGTVKNDNAAYETILSGDLGELNNPLNNAYHVALGVNIPADGRTILDGFTITGGNADYGGPDLQLVIGDTTIYQSNGGGIYNYYNTATSYPTEPVLTNVTISGNSAANGGGMFSNYDSYLEIRNSIIWGNVTTTGPGIVNDSDYMPTISYSIVEGSGGSGVSWVGDTGIDGGHNQDVNPGFVTWVNPSADSWVATTSGDYRLGDGSPAVDMGSDSLYPAGANDTSVFPSDLSDAAKDAINAALAKDLAGNTCKQGGTIDMGAYEYQGE